MKHENLLLAISYCGMAGLRWRIGTDWSTAMVTMYGEPDSVETVLCEITHRTFIHARWPGGPHMIIRDYGDIEIGHDGCMVKLRPGVTE